MGGGWNAEGGAAEGDPTSVWGGCHQCETLYADYFHFSLQPRMTRPEWEE